LKQNKKTAVTDGVYILFHFNIMNID